MPKPESATAEETTPEQDEITEKITGKPVTKTEKEDEKENEGDEKPAPKANAKDEDHEPPADHPRFNQVYGKMKAYERRLEERDKDFEIIREHNRAMEEEILRLKTNKADKPDDPEPDPDIDPAAYRKWMKLQTEKNKEEDRKQREIDKHTIQVDMQKELHEDYIDMVKLAERDMAKDKELQKKIWNSDNPAREAYRYGKSKHQEVVKAEAEEEERGKSREKMDVEKVGDSGAAGEEEEVKLSDDQKRIIRNLWPDLTFQEGKKKYVTQMKEMGRV